MKYLFLLWTILFSAAPVMACQKLVALTSSDLSILDAGIGCWLRDSKKKQLIYDNMSKAVIKIDNNVIKLNRKTGDWDSGFYSCGKTYEYISEDRATNVVVKMEKAIKDRCIGEIIVKTSSDTIKHEKLSSNCGD